MTHGIIEILENKPKTSRSLMKAIEEKAEVWNREGKNQHPVFSSALPFNADSPFFL